MLDFDFGLANLKAVERLSFPKPKISNLDINFNMLPTDLSFEAIQKQSYYRNRQAAYWAKVKAEQTAKKTMYDIKETIRKNNMAAELKMVVDYNDPDVVNSWADIFWGGITSALKEEQPLARAFKTALAQNPAAWPLGIPKAWELFKDTVVAPIQQDEYAVLGINMLMQVSENLDVIANPIKGFLLDGMPGYKKSIGLDTKGRVNYDYDFKGLGANKPVTFILEMAAEILSDPVNLISLGSSAVVKNAVGTASENIAKKSIKEYGQFAIERGVVSPMTDIGQDAVLEFSNKLGKVFAKRILHGKTPIEAAEAAIRAGKHNGMTAHILANKYGIAADELSNAVVEIVIKDMTPDMFAKNLLNHTAQSTNAALVAYKASEIADKVIFRTATAGIPYLLGKSIKGVRLMYEGLLRRIDAKAWKPYIVEATGVPDIFNIEDGMIATKKEMDLNRLSLMAGDDFPVASMASVYHVCISSEKEQFRKLLLEARKPGFDFNMDILNNYIARFHPEIPDFETYLFKLKEINVNGHVADNVLADLYHLARSTYSYFKTQSDAHTTYKLAKQYQESTKLWKGLSHKLQLRAYNYNDVVNNEAPQGLILNAVRQIDPSIQSLLEHVTSKTNETAWLKDLKKLLKPHEFDMGVLPTILPRSTSKRAFALKIEQQFKLGTPVAFGNIPNLINNREAALERYEDVTSSWMYGHKRVSYKDKYVKPRTKISAYFIDEYEKLNLLSAEYEFHMLTEEEKRIENIRHFIFTSNKFEDFSKELTDLLQLKMTIPELKEIINDFIKTIDIINSPKLQPIRTELIYLMKSLLTSKDKHIVAATIKKFTKLKVGILDRAEFIINDLVDIEQGFKSVSEAIEVFFTKGNENSKLTKSMVKGFNTSTDVISKLKENKLLTQHPVPNRDAVMEHLDYNVSLDYDPEYQFDPADRFDSPDMVPKDYKRHMIGEADIFSEELIEAYNTFIAFVGADRDYKSGSYKHTPRLDKLYARFDTVAVLDFFSEVAHDIEMLMDSNYNLDYTAIERFSSFSKIAPEMIKAVPELKALLDLVDVRYDAVHPMIVGQPMVTAALDTKIYRLKILQLQNFYHLNYAEGLLDKLLELLSVNKGSVGSTLNTLSTDLSLLNQSFPELDNLLYSSEAILQFNDTLGMMLTPDLPETQAIALLDALQRIARRNISMLEFNFDAHVDEVFASMQLYLNSNQDYSISLDSFRREMKWEDEAHTATADLVFGLALETYKNLDIKKYTKPGDVLVRIDLESTGLHTSFSEILDLAYQDAEGTIHSLSAPTESFLDEPTMKLLLHWEGNSDGLEEAFDKKFRVDSDPYVEKMPDIKVGLSSRVSVQNIKHVFANERDLLQYFNNYIASVNAVGSKAIIVGANINNYDIVLINNRNKYHGLDAWHDERTIDYMDMLGELRGDEVISTMNRKNIRAALTDYLIARKNSVYGIKINDGVINNFVINKEFIATPSAGYIDSIEAVVAVFKQKNDKIIDMNKAVFEGLREYVGKTANDFNGNTRIINHLSEIRNEVLFTLKDISRDNVFLKTRHIIVGPEQKAEVFQNTDNPYWNISQMLFAEYNKSAQVPLLGYGLISDNNLVNHYFRIIELRDEVPQDVISVYSKTAKKLQRNSERVTFVTIAEDGEYFYLGYIGQVSNTIKNYKVAVDAMIDGKARDVIRDVKSNVMFNGLRLEYLTAAEVFAVAKEIYLLERKFLSVLTFSQKERYVETQLHAYELEPTVLKNYLYYMDLLRNTRAVLNAFNEEDLGEFIKFPFNKDGVMEKGYGMYVEMREAQGTFATFTDLMHYFDDNLEANTLDSASARFKVAMTSSVIKSIDDIVSDIDISDMRQYRNFKNELKFPLDYGGIQTIENFLSHDPDQMVSFLRYKALGVVVFNKDDLEYFSSTPIDHIIKHHVSNATALYQEFIINIKDYKAKGVRHLSDLDNIYIWLDKDKDVTDIKPYEYKRSVKLKESVTGALGIHFPNMIRVMDRLNHYSDGASRNTMGEIMNPKAMELLREQLPEEVLNSSYSIYELKRMRMFSSVIFNNSVLGKMKSKKKFVPFYSFNIVKNQTVAIQELAKRANSSAKFAAIFLEDNNRLQGAFFNGFSPQQVLDYFKSNPGYSVAHVMKHDTKGTKLVSRTVRNLKDAEEVIAQNYAVAPNYVITKAKAVINRSRISNDLVRMLDKYYVGSMKLGYLTTEGFPIRNIPDSTFKNIFESKDLGAMMAYTAHTSKIYIQYKSMMAEILHTYGGFDTNIFKEYFLINSKPPIDKELFFKIHQFIEDAPSAGYSQEVSKYYNDDANKLILKSRLGITEELNLEQYEELLTLNDEHIKDLDYPITTIDYMLKVKHEYSTQVNHNFDKLDDTIRSLKLYMRLHAKTITVDMIKSALKNKDTIYTSGYNKEIIAELEFLLNEEDFILRARNMAAHSKDNRLGTDILIKYLKRPDLVTPEFKKEFNKLLKYDKKLRADIIAEKILYNKGAQTIVNLNSFLEQVFRLTQYLYSLDQGTGSVKAIDNMTHAHFDPTNKTQAQLMLEMLVPFSTFTTKSFMLWLDYLENTMAGRIISAMFKPVWDFDDTERSKWDYKYRKSLQYLILSGNVPLAKIVKTVPLLDYDTKVVRKHFDGTSRTKTVDMFVTLKLSPSIMDMYNIIMDPVSSGRSRLLAPIRALLDTYDGNKVTKETYISMIPWSNTFYQRMQTSNKYYKDTGVIANKVLGSIVGRSVIDSQADTYIGNPNFNKAGDWIGPTKPRKNYAFMYNKKPQYYPTLSSSPKYNPMYNGMIYRNGQARLLRSTRSMWTNTIDVYKSVFTRNAKSRLIMAYIMPHDPKRMNYRVRRLYRHY